MIFRSEIRNSWWHLIRGHLLTALGGLFLLFMLIDLFHVPTSFYYCRCWVVCREREMACERVVVVRGGGKYFSVFPQTRTICMLHHTYMYIHGWVGTHKKVTTDHRFQGKYIQCYKGHRFSFQVLSKKNYIFLAMPSLVRRHNRRFTGFSK